MNKVNKYILSVFVCAVLATNVMSDSTKAVQSMDKGLNWLKTQQRENGSWGNENYPAMTALGLWAFARGNHPDKANVCKKAATFVANFSQKDGGLYKPASGGRGSGGLSTYNVTTQLPFF